jgi:hypothetical protein
MATEFTGLLGDFLGYMQDPNRTQAMQGIGGLLQSGLTSMEESQNKWRELQKRAFGDRKNPMKVTDQAALDQLTEMTMAGPMGFAPAGITKKPWRQWLIQSVLLILAFTQTLESWCRKLPTALRLRVLC